MFENIMFRIINIFDLSSWVPVNYYGINLNRFTRQQFLLIIYNFVLKLFINRQSIVHKLFIKCLKRSLCHKQ